MIDESDRDRIRRGLVDTLNSFRPVLSDSYCNGLVERLDRLIATFNLLNYPTFYINGHLDITFYPEGNEYIDLTEDNDYLSPLFSSVVQFYQSHLPDCPIKLYECIDSDCFSNDGVLIGNKISLGNIQTQYQNYLDGTASNRIVQNIAGDILNSGIDLFLNSTIPSKHKIMDELTTQRSSILNKKVIFDYIVENPSNNELLSDHAGTDVLIRDHIQIAEDLHLSKNSEICA